MGTNSAVTSNAAPAAATAASGQANENSTQAAPVRLAPFTRGAMKHTEPFEDVAAVATANGAAITSLDIPSFGYLRGIWILVNATGGAHGGATVAAKEDSPFSAVSNIVLADVNGAQIVGPIDGYDLFLINLIGGYLGQDPRLTNAYAAVDTNGNFKFLLWIPLEICERDALGSMANQNASSTYKLSLNYGITANIYSTAPDTQPSVRVRLWLAAWTQPTPTDLSGNPQAEVPPAFGTTQFWTRAQFNLNSGAQTVRLTRVGNVIRSVIGIFRTTAPARNTADLPDPMQLQLEGRIVQNIGIDLLRFIDWEQSVTPLAENDATNPNPAGVFAFNFDTDLAGKSGNEMRDLWVPTSQATRLELVGSFGAAGTLTIITNDIAPAGDYHLT